MIIILNLTNTILLKVPLTNWRVHIFVILELESPILESHIPLWDNECGLQSQLLNLDPLSEQILTHKPSLNFSQFSESVLPESKSIILYFHTPFWDKGVENNDSEIIFKI